MGTSRWPHETIWSPLGYEGVRLRLADLAAVPIPAEPEEHVAEPKSYRHRAAEQWQRA